MAFARVQQRSRSVPWRQEQHVSHNMFDLSHDHKLTFTMGKLVPFLTKEVMPGDKWFIRCEAMLRFAPLYLPIMHRVNVSLDYHYVPYRLLWPLRQNVEETGYDRSGWEVFINPGDPAVVDSGSSVHPYIVTTAYDAVSGFSAYANELPQYMGFPTALPGTVGVLNAFQLNAFPFFAYYMIWDWQYRNDQIQERIFSQCVSGNNTSLLPGTGGPEFLACKYRNWNRDNFTAATPTPQIGAEVQIPMFDVDYMDAVTGTEFNGPYRWRQQSDDTPSPSGDLIVGAGGPLGHTEAGVTPVYLDIQETAASIAQLRYSLMLQEYLERAMRAGDSYPDYINTFFGVNPFAGVIQVPQYLGSKKGRVVVSEVMSTAETATLKVGSYAGQALAIESSNDTIELEAKEHGIIIGLISVYPDSSYMQGIDKMFLRQLPTDYPLEQFALIGDEAILNKEVNAQVAGAGTPEYNDEIFGYNRRYYDWIYSNDIYSGLMRTTFISFHLGRLLSVTDPQLTVLDSAFIECRPDVMRVFQVAENEDEIYCHIYNDIKVLRRLPKFGIPAV